MAGAVVVEIGAEVVLHEVDVVHLAAEALGHAVEDPDVVDGGVGRGEHGAAEAVGVLGPRILGIELAGADLAGLVGPGEAAHQLLLDLLRLHDNGVEPLVELDSEDGAELALAPVREREFAHVGHVEVDAGLLVVAVCQHLDLVQIDDLVLEVAVMQLVDAVENVVKLDDCLPLHQQSPWVHGLPPVCVRFDSR